MMYEPRHLSCPFTLYSAVNSFVTMYKVILFWEKYWREEFLISFMAMWVSCGSRYMLTGQMMKKYFFFLFFLKGLRTEKKKEKENN